MRWIGRISSGTAILSFVALQFAVLAPVSATAPARAMQEPSSGPSD